MTAYRTQSLAFAEVYLDKPIADIVTEASSDPGLSLRTLIALAAALHVNGPRAGMPLVFYQLQFDAALATAGADIDKRGAAAVGAEVGKALGHYIETVLAERS